MIREARENCGVVGARCHREDVISRIYWALLTLNHRGHESYGIATLGSDRQIKVRKGLGLISDLDIETLTSWRKVLDGNLGIGHVRYATSGQISGKMDLLADAQPIIFEYGRRSLCLAFNGNITNLLQLLREFSKENIELGGSSDIHALAYLIARELSEADLPDAMKSISEKLDGAYAIVGLTDDGTLFAFRDPHGIRPLSHGLSEDENLYMVASESVALSTNNILDFSFVKPGELIMVGEDHVDSMMIKAEAEAFCAFEYAYFARPDSKLQGKRYVFEIRRELGRNLARRYEEVARRVDVIVPVPQTAEDAAYGFHLETGKPIEPIIVRHRYLRHRAFITPKEQRELILSHKYNLLLDRVKGKRIALIDDSIVRGDTLRHLVCILKAAGAREVHVFSTFPKIANPCFYGIDMATFEELIGFNRGEEEIARLLEADSVNYQRIEDFYKAVGTRKLCLACVTGRYPTPYAQRIADEGKKLAIEGKRVEGRLFEVVG